ncbi:MAG TPA: hypothetical protein VK741_23595 [Acetobacteraceae bacterium]|jgi:hypothetical protein|nr:hypothetical protein [Acetobacteraceae bacterium]
MAVRGAILSVILLGCGCAAPQQSAVATPPPEPSRVSCTFLLSHTDDFANVGARMAYLNMMTERFGWPRYPFDVALAQCRPFFPDLTARAEREVAKNPANCHTTSVISYSCDR